MTCILQSRVFSPTFVGDLLVWADGLGGNSCEAGRPFRESDFGVWKCGTVHLQAHVCLPFFCGEWYLRAAPAPISALYIFLIQPTSAACPRFATLLQGPRTSSQKHAQSDPPPRLLPPSHTSRATSSAALLMFLHTWHGRKDNAKTRRYEEKEKEAGQRIKRRCLQ
jgi:hypothetical protein